MHRSKFILTIDAITIPYHLVIKRVVFLVQTSNTTPILLKNYNWLDAEFIPIREKVFIFLRLHLGVEKARSFPTFTNHSF